MHCGGPRILGLAALLAVVTAGDARAQYGYGNYPGGYGGYGWGGWGGASTVEGNVAQGLGYYAQGLGQYNVETAQARSINADTAMRWNQYWWEAQVAQTRAERERLARRQARDSGAGAAAEKRIIENPTDDDIANGNALNAALQQISNPKVHSSSLRLGTTKIPGKLIRQIPFVNASEAVTFSLDQLTTESGWPSALKDAKYEDERKAYSEAIDKALAEDVEGDISAATIKQVRDALSRLRVKYNANLPKDIAQKTEAEKYLKALYGMTRMLDRPDVEKVIAELDTIKETSLGNLLGFMHTFNLRFGRPVTPQQRLAYESLYPLIDELRDKVVGSLEPSKEGAGETTPPPPAPKKDFHPGEFFNDMKLDHLEGPHRIIDKPGSK